MLCILVPSAVSAYMLIPSPPPSITPSPTTTESSFPNPTPTSTPQNESHAMISGVLAHELTDTQASLLSSNGIHWIRSDVSINQSEINWHSIYRLAKEHNLSLIGTLDPYTMNFSNTFTLSDWQRTVQTAVTNYGDTVSAWEIWNEPTFPQSICGYYNGTAQQYVDLMRTAYQIIKSEHPNATVLGLGGMPLYSGENDTLVQQSLIFTQQVCSLGGMNYCDAISLHAYPYGSYTSNAGNAYVSAIASYRNITGKDVWITETGQESTGNELSQEEQAKYLGTSFALLKSQNVTAFIWYELSDVRQGNVHNDNSTFGLYYTNSTPKIALETYFRLVSGA